MFTNKKREGINEFVCDVSLWAMSLKHLKPQSNTINPHYPKYLSALSRTVLLDNLSRNSCIYYKRNRPFPSSLGPLFQNESKCETFHMKMSSACSFIFMQIKVIFIRMVSHLDSL